MMMTMMVTIMKMLLTLNLALTIPKKVGTVVRAFLVALDCAAQYLLQWPTCQCQD